MYTKYIFLFFIILIFFIYGLVLSEIIDFLFPDYNESKEEYKIFIEIISEVGIAYIVYFSLQYYSQIFINKLLKSISRKSPQYLNTILLIAFSTGIFRHLQKSSTKISYFTNKIKLF